MKNTQNKNKSNILNLCNSFANIDKRKAECARVGLKRPQSAMSS